MRGSHHEAGRCDGEGCFSGDTIDRSHYLIYVEVQVHRQQAWLLLNSAVTCHTPSGLHLVGPLFVVQQDNEPKHISRLYPKPNLNPG